jgi:glycosyltransferase involved in cell wall biosynthesis
MPTWNRAQIIGRAIESLLSQTASNWECIIIDDGSTDDTRQVIDRYLKDERFRYLYKEHENCARARNLGLRQAKGEIVTYLDTDNVWLPHYLSAVIDAFNQNPDINAMYACQIVEERGDSSKYFFRGEPFNYQKLLDGNYIDLNVFAHRRKLVESLGPFDDQLARLSDWDMILRYGAREKIAVLPILGGVYYWSRQDGVSAQESLAYNRYLVEAKQISPIREKVKVLYALWHYPQLSESYIEAEIQTVRKLGVDVEVWSECGVSAPFPSEVPVHRGTLQEAVEEVHPDVVHTHWLHMARKYGPMIKEKGLAVTVRGHSFEFTENLVKELDQDPVIQAIYLYPHRAALFPRTSRKVKSMPVAFNPDLYRPSKNKNRRLVMRTGAGLPTKDLPCFLETAKLCPDHHFLLVLAYAFQREDYTDEIIEMNRRAGSPVEVRVNLQYEEMSRLMSEAGIYMHTADPRQPFGMAVSISEAMATGCYMLLRRRPETYAYAENVASYYDTPEEAADLIKRTMQWTESDWLATQVRSVDHAYERFVSTRVLQTLVSDWCEIAAARKLALAGVRSPSAHLLR